MPISVFLAATILQNRVNVLANGPYDSSVPVVEKQLGYELGDRITTFRDQEKVLLEIAQKASQRVRVLEYGKSVQGRPLRVFAISSEKNIQQLSQIQAQHQKIAQGETVPTADLPAIVWINECIHGNEPASFESAMALIYNLAASRSATFNRIRNETVVMVNPVYNPDGHERFAVYYNSIARGGSVPGIYEHQEPGVVQGRTNHYRFDMNRDRIAFSQAETQQEFSLFLKWNPQVYVDQHGQVDTYFFPPEPLSINANVDRERNEKWTETIGKDIGKAFDSVGFQYYVRDVFDLYYPGYLDSSTTLSGAIGMTHETDGGKFLAAVRADGSKLTFRRGIEKHFVAAKAVCDSVATNRSALLESALAFKKKVISGEAAGKFQRVVVTSPDVRALRRLSSQLMKAGIKVRRAERDFEQTDAHDFWSSSVGTQKFSAGALIVDMNQAQGAFAKALLEPGQNFEKEFIAAQLAKKKSAPDGEEYPGPESPEFYDLTGWALPYAHGLSAWWCESRTDVATTPFAPLPPSSAVVASPDSTIGYAIPYVDQDDILAVHDALAAGVRASVSPNVMKLGGREFGAGTFMFLSDRNEPGFEHKVREAASRRHATLVPITTSFPDSGRKGPGSESVRLLRKPKIGVIFGTGSSLAAAGGIWFAMENVFHLPFDALSASAISGNLSEYTCLVVPSGSGVSISPKLQEWVRGGGRLVVLENFGWAIGANGFVTLENAKEKTQDLPGTLFRASLDPRSPLSFGYPRGKTGDVTLAVPVAGSRFYASRKEGGTLVRVLGGPDSLLSGWSWPEESEKAITDSVWLQDVPVGEGHVYLFTWDPTDRAMWPGLHKLLLNSMLL
jgi:hypothetical protein